MVISNNVVTFTPSDPKNIVNLVGINDANLKLLEETYDISMLKMAIQFNYQVMNLQLLVQ